MNADIKRKVLIFFSIGVLASLIMILSDWLLGYVNPIKVGDNFMILEGYSDFSLWRATASMALATIATALYLFPLYGLMLTISEKMIKYRKLFLVFAVVGIMPWLFIHMYYSMAIYNYSYLYNLGYKELAYDASAKMVDAFYINVKLLYIVMALPFLLNIIAVVRGITIFPKWLIFTNPVVIYCTYFLFNRLLPENAIVSAISMGILNEGMFIWLVSSLVYLLVKVKTNEIDF